MQPTGVAAGDNEADGAPGFQSRTHFRRVATCRWYLDGHGTGAVMAEPAKDMLPMRGVWSGLFEINVTDGSSLSG